MNPPDLNAGQWMVAVRPHGEILTASASESSIELGVLGIPSGYSPAEIEGWLHDLIGVARETAREDTRMRPIPALLHHGLTGLLFSHAQLWNRDGERHPASYAIVRSGGTLAFGWIGGAEVAVFVDGVAVAPGEVIVRDDDGREARAFELPEAGSVEIRLAWFAGEATPLVELDARWSALPAVVEEASPPAAAAPPEPDDVFEMPAVRIAAPAGPVAPMEGIERESYPVRFPVPETSFLDTAAEPLDLESGMAPPAAAVGVPAERAVPEPAASPGGSDAGRAVPAAAAHGAIGAPPPPVPHADHDVVQARAAVAGMQPAPPAPAAPPPVEPPMVMPPVAVGETPVVEAPQAVAEQMSIEPHPATATIDDGEWGMDAPAAIGAEDELVERPSRLRRLFSRFAFWRQETPAADAGLELGDDRGTHDVPGVPAQVPPTPESAEITERAVSAGIPAASIEPEGLVGAEEALEETEAAPHVEHAGRAPGDVPTDAGAGDGLAVTDAPHAPEEARAHAPMPAGEPAAHHGGSPAAPAPPASGEAARAAAPATLEPVTAAQPVPAPLAASPAPPALAPPIEPHVVDPAGPRAFAPAPETHADGTAVRTPLRPHWPTADELKPPPLWKRPWTWAALFVALFAGGWLVGHMNDERRDGAARGVREAMRAIGLGGARFEAMVNSRPPGAWITVDGRDLARRTPATIELEPGVHDVTLSFSDLGAATFQVRGTDGDRLALDPPLWGSLNVYSSDAEVPVAVSVDGVARGFAPTRIDSLQPGAHEIRFSGPGLPSWGQTVQVRVNESADLIARPMTSPATGVIEVRASLATESGSVNVDGANVWLDAQPAGVTPLTLELSRGPHSIRIEYQGESSPVQVIDLPGGNQRFANFMLTPGAEFPTLTLIDPPAVIPLDRPTVVSAALEGVQSAEIREMWLHVQTPDGPWRRYQMAWLKAPGGTVGVAVFPTTLFGGDGRVACYTSAATQAGDEYFSEIHVMSRPDAAPRVAARKR